MAQKTMYVLGDCMDIMPTFPDNFIDLAIVDPPYGIKEGRRIRARDKRRKVRQKNGTYSLVKSDMHPKGDWDDKPPCSSYFDELFRISKNQIIWGVNNYGYYKFGPGRIVWDKVTGPNDFGDCEIAYCSLFDKVELVQYMWNGMMQGKSIKQGNIQNGNKKKNEKRIHATQKPVILYKYLLDRYAKPGYLIGDTHGGSGSLGIACHDLGFDFLYIEKNEVHFNDAMYRHRQHFSKLTFF
jgi:site-specific DNA-methyltransferase (adenine-specific)